MEDRHEESPPVQWFALAKRYTIAANRVGSRGADSELTVFGDGKPLQACVLIFQAHRHFASETSMPPNLALHL